MLPPHPSKKTPISKKENLHFFLGGAISDAACMETPPQRASPHVPEDREDADGRTDAAPTPRREMPPVQRVRARESCPPTQAKNPRSSKRPTSEQGCSQAEERRTPQRLFFCLLLLSSGEGLCFGREEETSESCGGMQTDVSFAGVFEIYQLYTL